MKHEAADSGITLALGGIGMRGALNIGLLQAVAEANIPVKRIVATGISAIIGAQFALGGDLGEVLLRITQFFEENSRSMWEVEQLGGMTTGERRMAAQSLSYFLRESLFCQANLKRMGVFSWDIVEEKLSQAFGGRTLAEMKIPFAVSAIDIEQGKETLLSDGAIIDVVRAGIAFPGLFPPVKIGEHRYVSSATYCSLPLFSLSDADSPILAVLYPKHRKVKRPRSMIEILARVDEIRENALTKQTLSKADKLIEVEAPGGSTWGSIRRLDKAIPLVKRACMEELSGWNKDAVSN